jgi:DNA-binding NarL/FixJ family response regulator
MFSDIIRAALAEAPGIAIAGNVSREADIALEVRLANADAVIMEISEPSVSTNFSPLLQDFPALKVVAIDSTSKTGYVHQLRPCSIRLAELSAETLQSALRGNSNQYYALPGTR